MCIRDSLNTDPNYYALHVGTYLAFTLALLLLQPRSGVRAKWLLIVLLGIDVYKRQVMLHYLGRWFDNAEVLISPLGDLQLPRVPLQCTAGPRTCLLYTSPSSAVLIASPELPVRASAGSLSSGAALPMPQQNRLQDRWPSCPPQQLPHLFCEPAPVSYTHLDVYKRQLHYCSEQPEGLYYVCLLYTSRCV